MSTLSPALDPNAFAGIYRFAGDPADLLEGYDRLMATLPEESIQFHACITGPDGMLVIDSCPDEATFRGFANSPDVRAAMAAAGLPDPDVEFLGTIVTARVRGGG